VDPSVRSHADLAGRSIALDALDTGFAFVLYEMLERAGVDRDRCQLVAVGATPQRWHSVRDGTHAATLTIEPFTSVARAAGFDVLDSSTRLFESYQGGVVTAPRQVLDDQAGAVRAFVDGYLDGLGWVLEPSNRDAVRELLVRRMDLDPRAVERVLDSVLSPGSGLTPEAELLTGGIQTVLDLRSRHGPGGELADVASYTDVSVWKSAIESRRERG
jgi:ABC-type nitrate/sulfonate/bicarbonate transport system substrate-binding protein